MLGVSEGPHRYRRTNIRVCLCVLGEGVTSRIAAGSLIPDRHRNPDWDFSPSLPGHSHAILHGGF